MTSWRNTDTEKAFVWIGHCWSCCFIRCWKAALVLTKVIICFFFFKR